MNRNVSRQLAPERGVDIRMPSTAVLGVSSADRYANNTDRALNATSPFDVLLTSRQNFLNGFFTRVALTEVRIPWFLPTLTARNNTIMLQYFPSGTAPTLYTITLTPGWYTPTTLAAELQRVIRLPVGSGGANLTGFTCAYSTAQFAFTATASAGGDEFIFLPTIVPGASSRTGLYEMMNWVNNYVAFTQTSGVPTMLSTEFVDIVCNQLTYAQDVKDGDTGRVSRDVICRVYLARDGVDSAPDTLGSTPFVVYRQFQTPKQIKWDSNLPIGQMQFDLYDDRGLPLTTAVPQGVAAAALDTSMGEWSLTLLVSEV